MKLNAAARHVRMENMSLKQLFYVYEMASLTQSIGEEEVRPPPTWPKAAPDTVLAINTNQSLERLGLQKQIWGHVEGRHWRIYGKEPYYPWVHAKEEGCFLGFVVLWDHWQPSLREIVGGCRRKGDRSPSPSMDKRWISDGFGVIARTRRCRFSSGLTGETYFKRVAEFP